MNARTRAVLLGHGVTEEGLYQRLFEAAPAAILGVGGDGLIVLANARAEALFGYSRDELMGRSIDLLVPEASRAAHVQERARYLADPQIRPMWVGRDVVGRRSDGSTFSAEVFLTSVDTDDGPLVTASVIDVSERKRIEAQYRELLEAGPDAIVGVGEDGRISLVNAQTEALFGYRREELLGQPVEMLVPQADRAAHLAHRAEYLTDPRTRPMGAGMELAGRRRDGTEFPAEISLAAIETETGVLVSAAVRDGTERKQAAIVGSSRDPIISTNPLGVITSWNRAATAVYGYEADEIIGRPVSVLMSPDTWADEQVGYDAAVGGQAVAEFDTEHVTAGGSKIHMVCTLSPIIDAKGAVVGVSTFGRDVTERIKAEAERQALEDRLHQSERLESLGQLAGGVAHDFNNLLSVILNYASFVAEELDEDDPARADVDEIRLAAERAARLTRQLLIFGRRETARPELLDLNLVLADVHTLLSRTLGEHVELSVQPAEGQPLLLADRGQIEQVLLNLAVNSRDAMPDGGLLTIEVGPVELDEHTVAIQPGLRPGQYVLLTVSDTGMGMSQEVIDHAFDPFYTTKPKGEGTGLGLATVYGVVSEAGGAVTIYSEPGLGTTIRVYLRPAGVEEEPDDPTASPAPRTSRSGTILLVEDEAAIRRVSARILARNGYEVLQAGSGAEALELAASALFDILLTDVVMPQMSGPELAERIGQMRPGVRVLFMSGYSQGILGASQGLDDGVALLDKPFSEQSLLDKLAELGN